MSHHPFSRRFVHLALSAGLAVVLPSALALAEERVITIHAFHRPPYYVFEENAQPAGFLLDIAREVLARAGLAYRVENLPPKRILADYENKDDFVCAVGWYKTPEREAFARFSDPIYVNRPQGMVVAREKAGQFPERPTSEQVFATAPRVGVKEGFSYGQWLDDKLAAHGPAVHRTVTENALLLEMTALGRVDVVFIEPEEYAWILKDRPHLAERLRFFTLADAPEGETRHIMCDLPVGDEVMTRLNKAIAAFRRTPEYRRLTSQAGPP